ncbi:unnamed protein product [Rotaria sordida]|uniref:RING-type domain-containing protein n=1 Tax=Rotaria sordida TaxID=392033 RepID=A0A814SIZ4_9BILA|nr:unnamed protein product [Rotaria sordida]
MESFVQCHYCKKDLNNPLELVCRHSYCTDCLKKEIQNDKIICPICGTEHPALAASLSSASQDKLATYVIGLNSGEPYSVITDDAPATIVAACSECRNTTDLRPCFHCGKPLCADCRTKHYESQKKEVDKSITSLMTTTNELIVLAQALNTSRSGRIQEYKTIKEQVSTHVKDLVKKLHDDEQVLQKKLDATIQAENEKIAVTERERQYLEKNKAALDQVMEKYRNETNQMILIKMHKDYLDTAPVWKDRLHAHANRISTKKEEELHFHPIPLGTNDGLVGKLTASKNVNVNAPSNDSHLPSLKNPTGSRSCIIL